MFERGVQKGGGGSGVLPQEKKKSEFEIWVGLL